jgi:putative ABC transport system substrate-binding protein
MDRRTFVATLTFGVIATPLAAEAQQAGKVWRIGILGVGTAPTSEGDMPPVLLALRQGLSERGYVEGQNAASFARCPAGMKDATRSARSLASLNPDVIVTWSNELTEAAKRATSTIPIVFIAVTEPERGLVTSLAKPGSNLSGLSHMTSELNGKRLELLSETLPRVERFGVLVRQRPGRPLSQWNRATLLQPTYFEARTPSEIAQAFVAISKAGVGALLVYPDPEFYVERQRIVAAAAEVRIPAIYESRDFVTAGGLMAYGADIVDLSRRAATYVDRILRGVKPRDLPVEQPTKFELVINLKTAKALGLTIPPSVLLRADQVIE